MVHEAYAGADGLRYEADFSFLDALILARDQIHLGRALLTHPLAGGVRPGRTPYKTILLSKKPEGLHAQSLALIEQCIHRAQRLTQETAVAPPGGRIDRDLQFIDFCLTQDCIDEYLR